MFHVPRLIFQCLSAMKFCLDRCHVQRYKFAVCIGLVDLFAHIVVVESWRLGLFDEKVNSVGLGVFYPRESAAGMDRGELVGCQLRLD